MVVGNGNTSIKTLNFSLFSRENHPMLAIDMSLIPIAVPRGIESISVGHDEFRQESPRA